MAQSTGENHPYIAGDGVDYTWSARFAFERPHTFEDAVLRKLGGIVTSYGDPEWPLSGAVPGSGDAEDRTSLVLGLDPSGNFGTPDRGRCEKIAAKITKTLGWQRQPEDLAEMRVILGRRIGYDGAEYSVEDVRGLAVARGCGGLALTEADLFSLRYVNGLREYHEPGVIIEGPAHNATDVLRMAAEMDQERLVTEVTDVATQAWAMPRDA